jgi:CotH protein/lamin tail-like protein
MEHKMIKNFICLALFMCIGFNVLHADVVINEISYNPTDMQYQAGSLREFVELYNPGSESIDISGYQFTKGITYTFPDETVLESGQYIVLARDPKDRSWRSKSYTIIGPYEGYLANSGERLTLVRPDGTVVEEFKYNDSPPWTRTADGYGSSLERISWDLPADDYHSWRASLMNDGTPGAENSVINVIPRPMIVAHDITPEHPTSTDNVTISMNFDSASIIDSVTLQWEETSQIDDNSGQAEWYVVMFDKFKYTKGLEAPSEGDDWTRTDFDDSSWRTGNGMHGISGSDMISTRLRDMPGKYSTVYLRKDFTMTDAETLKSALLYVFFSGGFVCYLNGTEIQRENITGVVSHDSLATQTHDMNVPELYIIENVNGLLKNGENTLSIVGINTELDQSSFGIGVYLFEGEKTSSGEDGITQATMNWVAEDIDTVTFEALIPPVDSQTLVRFNAIVTLDDSSSLILPYVTTLRPFESYFVYDGEIESLMPVLWPYNMAQTKLTEMGRNVSGAVILPVGEEHPLVFDGALIYPSRNGNKLKFLKGEEFRGDRTLNMLPESPTGSTTAGPSTAHREELGFWFFREFGIPSPRTDWFRVITDGQQTQQLLIQQINERFLEMNDRNPDADLFKRNYVSPNWEPHTNLENGTASMDALTQALRPRDQDELYEALTTNLVIDEFLDYCVASVLSSNWDGFHNNNWMYLDPDTQKWEIIPWDLDKTWGYTDSNHMFAEMPINFPLKGQAAHASRTPGPITGKLHKNNVLRQEYEDRLTHEFNNSFSEERMFSKIAEIEQFLLADLLLLEDQIGGERENRRTQITESYETLRTFVHLRREYLSTVLQTPVNNWSLY